MAEDNVVELASRRPPFTYNVKISHFPDRWMRLEVADVLDSVACRLSVAEDLRRAAEMLEKSVADGVI